MHGCTCEYAAAEPLQRLRFESPLWVTEHICDLCPYQPAAEGKVSPLNRGAYPCGCLLEMAADDVGVVAGIAVEERGRQDAYARAEQEQRRHPDVKPTPIEAVLGALEVRVRVLHPAQTGFRLTQRPLGNRGRPADLQAGLSCVWSGSVAASAPPDGANLRTRTIAAVTVRGAVNGLT